MPHVALMQDRVSTVLNRVLNLWLVSLTGTPGVRDPLQREHQGDFYEILKLRFSDDRTQEEKVRVWFRWALSQLRCTP